MATSPEPIRFTDGAAYDRFMGVWSRLVGRVFLDWLALPKGLRWLDVGCGNGAFTALIAESCAPLTLHGIDPSEAQLAAAREHPSLQTAHLRTGDAMALPFPADSFDVAVMPLVIFFVPNPARGVAEMARVVAPGGTVAAYAWDMEGGGFPYQGVRDALAEFGVSTPMPPSPEASRPDVLRNLWTLAGLVDVETRAIDVERSFASFEELWAILLGGPSAGQALAAMGEHERARFRDHLHSRLQPAGGGPVILRARANAIRGRAQVEGMAGEP